MTVTLDKPKAQEKPIAAELVPGSGAPAEYRWTVDAYYRAYDAGAFGYAKRLELIQGRILENMGQGPRHATLASEIADMLRGASGKRFAIREEKPVRIDFDGEPIPDVMALKGRQADYGERQPAPDDVELLVEVSDISVEYDLGGKALLYAQAGIRDYWVVLVNDLAIVRHRQPTPEGYGEIVRLAGQDTLSPLAAPDAVWTVDALIGREE